MFQAHMQHVPTTRLSWTPCTYGSGSLKDEIKCLKSDLSLLQRNKNLSRAISLCHMGSSWKVKIPRDCLYNAMSSASLQSHSVRIWKNNSQASLSHHGTPSSCHVTELCQPLKVTALNCQGLHNSVPYVNHLIESGYDIIILEEHWLWPYELTSLKSLHPDFSYTAVSDKRLNPSSDLTRGCGGVAIVWRTSLRASALKLPDSDRLCDLHVELSDPDRSLHILGVYMPSAEQPQDVYRSHLDTVEHCIL